MTEQPTSSTPDLFDWCLRRGPTGWTTCSPEAATWIQIDMESGGDWLREALPEWAAAALLEDTPRPRVANGEDDAPGLLVMLRAANFDPLAEADDLTALRAWVDERRLITVRRRKLVSVGQVRERLEKPASASWRGPPELLRELVREVINRIEIPLERLEEEADRCEQALAGSLRLSRRDLAQLRHEALGLHLHLAPQRRVLAQLAGEQAQVELEQLAFREIAEQGARQLELLESLRERGKVMSDELDQRLNEVLGRRMYALAVLTAIFLPLSLLAGILGANVGGIPGANHSAGFWILCGLMTLLAALELWVLIRLGWLGRER